MLINAFNLSFVAIISDVAVAYRGLRLVLFQLALRIVFRFPVR